MSKTILSHLAKTGLSSSGHLNLRVSLYDPTILEKIVFRIGDLVHGVEFDLIMTSSSGASPIAAFLSITERVPWLIYDQYKHKKEDFKDKSILLVGLSCKNKGRRERYIIQNIGNISAIVYLVNANGDTLKNIFYDLNIRAFSLTTLESLKQCKA